MRKEVIFKLSKEKEKKAYLPGGGNRDSEKHYNFICAPVSSPELLSQGRVMAGACLERENKPQQCILSSGLRPRCFKGAGSALFLQGQRAHRHPNRAT